jgi:hypothetical protein
VIRIAITDEAYAAIERTLPIGTVAFEPARALRGQRVIWLEPRIVDKLRALRGPGESYSDVIIRLAADG